MEDKTESSEVTVFMKFVATLMSLQEQLDPHYHTHNVLRNRFLTAIGIPAVQKTFQDRIPSYIHQAVHRIGDHISGKASLAGVAFTFSIHPE